MKHITLLLATALCTVNAFAQAPNIEWQKTFGGTGNDYPLSIQQTTDGGYIVSGHTYSNDGDISGNHSINGNADICVLKLNSSGGIVWRKILGGEFSDVARSIQQTTDGGYIIAGITNSNNGDISGNHGMTDIWVVKLNDIGAIIWQKTLGGTGDDYATSIQQTTDGGYVVAGSSNSNDGDVSGNHSTNGNADFWVVKLNVTGTIVWQKTLGGTGFDCSNSIQQTIDGGYIATGYTNSSDGDVLGNHGQFDIWVVKLNAIGVIIWQKTLGGTADDIGTKVQQTTDSGYILAGQTKSNNADVSGNHGSDDAWVVKLSPTGAIIWQKTLGGTGRDYATSIKQTTDGGCILIGSTYSNDGDIFENHGVYDFWVVKLNPTGAILWQKTLGGTVDEIGNDVQQTTDGGYIATGYAGSNNGDVSGNHGGIDFWVVKLSPEIVATSAVADNAANIIVCPNPTNDFFIIQNTQNTNETFVYKIVDLLGREIIQSKSAFGEQINIKTLATGSYILQIKTESGAELYEKIVKK